MKKRFLAGTAVVIAVIVTLTALLTLALARKNCIIPETPARDRVKIIRGNGHVRGRRRTILRNKFAGFVSKVNFYSQSRVKAGDVILEYDDLDVRTAIEKLEHSIAEQKIALEQKRIELELKKIDPLPSEYRKTQWKLDAAKKRLERHNHELEVYKRLFTSKSISELSLREKAQEVKDAEADLLGYSDDLEKLKGGLAAVYIRQAECAVKAAEMRLKDLERELELQKEQLKYYKIVAPYDGVCITNSDTVHGWDAAGTSAAEVNVDDKKKVYAYFDEADIPYIIEGVPCRFRSNQYDCDAKGFATLMPYQVKKTRYSYGDKVLHLAKFYVEKEPGPLRIDSTGTVEIEVRTGR